MASARIGDARAVVPSARTAVPSQDPFSIADRIVVVTGGLGRLGRSFCRSFLAGGARVACLDLREPTGDERDALLDGVSSSRLVTCRTDITGGASLRAALEAIERKWGAPHALINNAGLDSPPDAPALENGPFETYPTDSFARVMEVNATGTFLACQTLGDAMARAGRGTIVNVASIYGLVSPDQRVYAYRAESGEPFTKPVAYSVSKSAIYGLTRYLATYWAPRGVRVNAVTLGGVYDGQDPEFLEGYCARVPLGRMAERGEYDAAMRFLISDASSYMTGANLVLDGGFTAW